MAPCPHGQSSKAQAHQQPSAPPLEGAAGLAKRSVLQTQITLPERIALFTGIGRRQSSGKGALGAALCLMVSMPILAVGQATPPDASPSAAPATASPASQTSAGTRSTTTLQPAPEPQPSPTGWLGFEQLQYSATALGTVLIEDTDLGYGLTEHLAADVGLPIIFTRSPFSPVVSHDYYWSALLGQPYLDVRYTDTYHELNYTSVLTGAVPAANEDRIYSTGRFGVDWFNHVDERIGNVTPFINFGASNGAGNRFVMPRPYSTARPYQSLGFLGDAEGGLEYKFSKGYARGVAIGASAYLLVPAGAQKVFSRYVLPNSSLGGDGNHNRYFDSTFETTSNWVLVDYTLQPTTTSNSKLARDNGVSGWLDVTRWRNLDVQLAYTRSVHYDLDIYTVTFTFDGRDLIRSLMPSH